MKWLVMCGAILVIVGCSRQQTASTAPTTAATSIDGSRYLLSTEPQGTIDVIKAREEVQDRDDVVVVGRIGGSENPWVDGRAAFSIVDTSLESCLECGSADCPKPWDYC